MIKNRLINLQESVDNTIPMTAGRIFYVIGSRTEPAYADLLRRNDKYLDGVEKVYVGGPGIQSALDACVSKRNDYVIVLPSTVHYDLTTPLIMSKKNVHLLCPAGMGHGVGSTNALLIHQNTANTNIITLTGDSCEIAGFWFRTFTSTTASVIQFSEASKGQCANIHHNTFTQQLSGATNGYAISGAAGGSGNYSNIHHNRFTVTGNGLTLTHCVKLLTTQSVFANNDMHAMNGATIGIGVQCVGVGSVIKNNYFYAHPSSVGIAASAFGACIYVDATNDSTCVIGNIGAVATGTMVQGGTNDVMYSRNFGAVDGGKVPVDQDVDT